jgi:hypothetical protein
LRWAAVPEMTAAITPGRSSRSLCCSFRHRRGSR